MRQSGVLMHITSLPGPYGVGTMGKHAYAFIDFLKAAGQSQWQLLPLTPTGFGNSPYQSCSTFAGNPYLIDLELLVEENLLTRQELDAVNWGSDETRVDFGALYENKLNILRKAFQRHGHTEDFARFKGENHWWLPGYGAFMVLKEHFYGAPWYQWPEELKQRKVPVIDTAVKIAGYEGYQFHCFVQYLFYRQWEALRAYAHRNGISIIGDVPIYVPYDSVEVWSDPELFQLDAQLAPTDVAGVPPDSFTADGQLWGNPLYRWDAHKKDGYSWWLRRMEAAGKLYDTVRFDHFRGLESYWAVPYGDATARYGRWVKGPGSELIEAIQKKLPQLRLIAEDLGYLTEEVLTMRDSAGLPGMKILEFAFDSREPSDYLPHTYTRNAVCYTGTHDNMTMQQWFDTCSPDARAYAMEYMNLSEREGLVWGAVRTCMSCVCDTCILPMQDLLALGGEARMNFPGTLSDNNWTWRIKDDIITKELAQKLYKLTALYGRLGNQKEADSF